MNAKILLLTSACLGAAHSTWAFTYELIDLGLPSGYSQSVAVDVTNSGWVAVNGLNSPTESNGFLYYSGAYSPVPNLARTDRSLIFSINESAQVVGTEWSGQGPTGFFYDQGVPVLSERAAAVGGSDYARVINDAGMILGGATDWGAGSWIYDSGGYFDVDSTVPALSLTYDINNNGTMLAYNGTLGGYYVWDATQPGVASPHLATLTAVGAMRQINDNGLLAGFETGNLVLADSTMGGWGAAPVTNGGSIGGGVTDVGDINDWGQVVGTFDNGVLSGAFLYNGMSILDLNTLIDPSLGWTLTTATGINDLGWIVGGGYDASGSYHAYLLKPGAVPEPSTYGLIGAAALGALVVWRRRKVRVSP